MTKSIPPSTFEDLVLLYDHFIETILRRVSRGAIRADDMPDMKQAVYLRLWQAWQPGSRSAFCARRGAFSTYLYLIIHSVALNQFDRNSREPDNQAVRLRFNENQKIPGTVAAEDLDCLLDTEFEDRAAARDLLARCRRVAKATENGAQLLRVLDASSRVVPTPRRLATELQVPLKDIAAAQQQLAGILDSLRKATA